MGKGELVIKTKKLYITHEVELHVPESMSRIVLVGELNKRFNDTANELGKVIGSSTKARGGHGSHEEVTS